MRVVIAEAERTHLFLHVMVVTPELYYFLIKLVDDLAVFTDSLLHGFALILCFPFALLYLLYALGQFRVFLFDASIDFNILFKIYYLQLV